MGRNGQIYVMKYPEGDVLKKSPPLKTNPNYYVLCYV